jgi:surfeit locus 1 family protein
VRVRGARFWIATAAAVLGCVVTAALGFWQLDRARQKEELALAIARNRAQPPLTAQDLQQGHPLRLVHRPVQLRGTWAAERTVFLDNRQMDGRVGFYVVTPLQLADSGAAVLVQRGWVPRNFQQREQLPAVATPAGIVEIAGRIAPPPARLYQFGAAGSGPIRQNLDIGAFAAETRLNLLPVSVLQTGAPSEGLLRNWPDTGGRGPETNYGYAFQWWSLSALIAILYAWFQFIQPRRQARQRR